MIAALLVALVAATAPPPSPGTVALRADGGSESVAASASPASPGAAPSSAEAASGASDAPGQAGESGAVGGSGCAAMPCTPEVPGPPPAPQGSGLRLAAVPVVAYASDTGWRVAGGIFLYDLDPSNTRNNWAAIQLSWTSSGPRYAEVKGEFRRLFGTTLRSFYQLKVSQDVGAPYWGEGASLSGGPPPGAGSPPEPYQYNVAGPWLAASLRGPVHGPFDWFVRARWTRRNISKPGAILEAERPLGYEGGGTALGSVGVVLDTRNDELGARSGLFADASVFAAPHWPGGGFSEYGFAGVNVTLREYVPLWTGATLAFRQLYDRKKGDVPFTERILLEGIGYGEGLGGAGTIRGLARDRVSGDEKMLFSVEVRSRVLETRLLSRSQEFGVSLGADAGRASQPGYSAVSALGAFAGLRMVWDRAVLIRFELGYAGQGAPAYYLSFDEPF